MFTLCMQGIIDELCEIDGDLRLAAAKLRQLHGKISHCSDLAAEREEVRSVRHALYLAHLTIEAIPIRLQKRIQKPTGPRLKTEPPARVAF